MTLAGGCHCGNLALTLETALSRDVLPLRACQCAFCTRHGARATSDASGRVRFTIRETEALIRYRFGLRTADFLVCARCGIYVAAVMHDGGAAFATVYEALGAAR